MVTKQVKVMLVTENLDASQVLREMLNKANVTDVKVIPVKNLGDLSEEFTGENLDILLLDLEICSLQVIENFLKRHIRKFTFPMVVLTPCPDYEFMIDIIKAGAQDCLSKINLDSHLLMRAIHYAIERKKISIELCKEHIFISSLINSIDTIIVVLNKKGEIVRFNRACEQMTGYSAEEVKGKRIQDIFLMPADKEEFNLVLEKLTAGQFPKRVENHWITKDGFLQLINWHYTVLFDEGGAIEFIIATGIDVTEQRKREEGRRKLEEKLQQTQKLEAIGTLAGGIAHDFNNILTVVLGNISLAKTYLLKEDKVANLLDKSEKAALIAKELTYKFITFSEGGEPFKKIISIASLIKDSVELALSGSNIKCIFSIPDDLWNIEIDRGQMGQVFINIINNAKDAMPEGGIIEIGAENFIYERQKSGPVLPLQEGNYIKIFFKDHGLGIQKGDLGKIFDPYFTTKDIWTQKGLGLGLTIVHSVIEKHGGYIDVESEVGVGTTFSIFLPAGVKESDENLQRGEEIREKTIIHSRGHILLMDDEKMVRETGKDIMEFLGYEVECARDGKEALALYQEAKREGKLFDLVILDLTIPGGMGGKEAVKLLREIDPCVKAIASTGHSNDPIIQNFKDYGFDDVVPKPYNIELISNVLSKAFSFNHKNSQTF